MAYKKVIGTLDGGQVFEIGLRGGLHIICGTRGRKVEYLGVGPHRAIARHIAKKHAPDLKITELEKSEQVRVEHFADLLPTYEHLTEAFAVMTQTITPQMGTCNRP